MCYRHCCFFLLLYQSKGRGPATTGVEFWGTDQTSDDLLDMLAICRHARKWSLHVSGEPDLRPGPDAGPPTHLRSMSTLAAVSPEGLCSERVPYCPCLSRILLSRSFLLFSLASLLLFGNGVDSTF